MVSNNAVEKFKVRPGFQSEKLLIEFCGDHRNEAYPNIHNILEMTLLAKSIKHPSLDTLHIAITTDEFITFWEYPNGRFELDDDIWSCFIHAPENNFQVTSDIERALLKSGKFVKEEVDFSLYK